jgi:hypothetical protein
VVGDIAAKLHLKGGDLRIVDDASGSDPQIQTYGPAATITTPGSAGTWAARAGNDLKWVTRIEDTATGVRYMLQDREGGNKIRFHIDENGDIGIGVENAINKLDVEGAAVIGSSYSGSFSAPADGLLVQGKVGIATPSVTLTPGYVLDVNGKIRIRGGSPSAGKVLMSIDNFGQADWQTLPNDIPDGVIVMWSGSLDDVPDDWALCDGQWHQDPDGNWHLTPNLIDRFIFGTGTSSAIRNVGGFPSQTHAHGANPPAAMSGQSSQTNWAPISSGSGGNAMWHTHTTDVPWFATETASVPNMPPYMKLAFIMKI